MSCSTIKRISTCSTLKKNQDDIQAISNSKIRKKKFSPEAFVTPLWGHGMMILGLRDLQNSNQDKICLIISFLKMAITLAFLGLFASFKRLNWSAWKGPSICEVCSVMKISRKQLSLWKESKSGGRNERKWKFDFKQL